MNRNYIISALSHLFPSLTGGVRCGSVLLLLLFSACSDHEGGGDDVPTVPVKLTVALPQRIVGTGTKNVPTRMTEDVVQEGQDAASFRGIDDVHMFCFTSYPTRTSDKTGSIIRLNALANDAIDETSEEDFTVNHNVQVPVGTTHFTFYGRAADAPQTHEERMHYGTMEVVGLSTAAYNGNSGIRFRPVSICNSTESCGGSAKGQALLGLLNDLVATQSSEAAPENSWATATNVMLQDSYKLLTGLKALSSFSVQYVLGKVWMELNKVNIMAPGYGLASMLIQKIENSCATAPAPSDEQIVLQDTYQGFPADLHLPAGAARVTYNNETGRFEEPAVQAYGKKLDIAAMSDYAYPMNLQYQVISELVASDELVLDEYLESVAREQAGQGTTGGNGTTGNTNPDGSTAGNDPTAGNGQTGYQGWRQLIDDIYAGASTVVTPTTQSVAMVQQLQYAVGKLSLRAGIESGTLYDAHGKEVDVTNGFTLKGYIVGGQREVDYDFQPVEGSREYAIYDTDINGGPQLLKQSHWTGYNYILGLSTAHDGNVYLAMELENNGEAFQGADGVIVHGATFYLVARMVPSEGTNYSAGNLDQIFRKDHSTTVSLKIMNGWPDKNNDGLPDPDLDEHGNQKPPSGLATATYGLPDIQVPPVSFGLSVDLNWKEGMTWNVPL